MTASVTLDKAGRIFIPKPMRDKLRLDVAGRLRNKLGIWVFGGTGRITSEETDAVLRRVRDQRDRHNRGVRSRRVA